jgi:hypothetical protein
MECGADARSFLRGSPDFDPRLQQQSRPIKTGERAAWFPQV